jgi:ATP-dependent Clp protease ATP-binding subunit ClpA
MMSKELEMAVGTALAEARTRRHEYLCVEHILYALTQDPFGAEIIMACGGNLRGLRDDLEIFFDRDMERIPEGTQLTIQQTHGLERMMQRAFMHVRFSGGEEVNSGDILAAILEDQGSHATYFLMRQGVTRLDVLNYISHGTAKLPDGDELDDFDEFDSEEDMEPLEPEEGMQGPQKKKRAKALETYAVSLTQRAAEGKLDPLIGREQELRRAIRVLCRRKKNNPVFVGEPGTGKTALAEGLALLLYTARQGQAKQRVPKHLQDAEILALDIPGMLAGARFRGDFEQRIKAVIKEALQRENVILFIDEIHTIVGAGATTDSSMDASTILKPALASGELRCIGSTTYADFKNHFERDHGLSRRFQKIDLNEPSVEETFAILKGLRSHYESHHGIRFTESALRAASDLSARHINDRFLPDKAIDLIDEAAASVRIEGDSGRKTVRPVDIEQVVAEIAGIPARNINSSDKERLASLDADLTATVFGQDEAITQVTRAIKRSRAGLVQPDRPIGCFLFTGPTGVGKTEVARQLANTLGNHFSRYDMSEYMEKHAVSRLIGAPPGYVGFDQGGLLVDDIRRHPYTVLLLDEIEKAHPDLFNILLQVMDNATLTDNTGRKADFRNVVLVMTSNAGARELAASSIGFHSDKDDGRHKSMKAIEKALTPEFRNRLDAIVTFNALPPEVVLLVVDKFVRRLNLQLQERGITLRLSEAARARLAEKGYDPKFGARPLARVLARDVETPLADEILFGRLNKGGQVLLDVNPEDEGFLFNYE